MRAQVLVRNVVHQDYEQWTPLWLGYNAFYGRAGDTALAPEVNAATWQRFFDAYEPVHALVAESDGELVGLTHYLFHRATTLVQPICYLSDLFTSEQARGKGVGRALIEHVIATARRAGCRDVILQVNRNNGSSIRAYEHCGFAIRKRGDFAIGNGFVMEDYIMVRSLET